MRIATLSICTPAPCFGCSKSCQMACYLLRKPWQHIFQLHRFLFVRDSVGIPYLPAHRHFRGNLLFSKTHYPGNWTYLLLKMAIYSEVSHETWLIFHSYVAVTKGYTILHMLLSLLAAKSLENWLSPSKMNLIDQTISSNDNWTLDIIYSALSPKTIYNTIENPPFVGRSWTGYTHMEFHSLL